VSAATILGADVTGPEAPPRRNGELVFDAPWEGRAFGTGMAMAQRGVFSFADLRDRLIEAIAAWERTHDDADTRWSYYERWLTALEELLVGSQLVDEAEIETRMAELAGAQAHEHDDHRH
jgi:nitrile hydratase accessory protein